MKSLSFATTVLKSNFAPLPLPYKLNFCVTYICQSRCLTCNIWEMRPKNELSLDECKQIAQRNPFIQWLQITGGEPFIRPDLYEIARAFSKNLYILSIPTNSLCYNSLVDRQLRAIKSLKIPHFVLTVSLDGDRALHDKIRGVKGNYDRAIQIFNLSRSLGLRTVFGYTISKFNAGQFARVFFEVKKEIKNLEVSDFHLNVAQYSANYYENTDLSLNPEPNAAVFDLIFYRAKLKGLNALTIMDKRFSKGLLNFLNGKIKPHRSLDTSVFVDSFGTVFPSIMHNQMIGCLRANNYELEPILNNQAAKDWRGHIQHNAYWTSCEDYQTILGDLRHEITG